jgi:hypothetical protein
MHEIIQRLDELDGRISSVDRNLTEQLKEIRADQRQSRHWLIGLYGTILAVAGIAVAIVKL